jgi:hypothetical protein
MLGKCICYKVLSYICSKIFIFVKIKIMKKIFFIAAVSLAAVNILGYVFMCTFPIFETEIEEVAVYKLDTCEIVVQHVLSNATTPPCIWVGKRSNKDSDIHSVHPYADYDSVYAFRVSKGQVFLL